MSRSVYAIAAATCLGIQIMASETAAADPPLAMSFGDSALK